MRLASCGGVTCMPVEMFHPEKDDTLGIRCEAVDNLPLDPPLQVESHFERGFECAARKRHNQTVSADIGRK